MVYRRKDQSKGIYCLEGVWNGRKDTTTVEPALRLLEMNANLRVPYFHYRIARPEELEFRLKEWTMQAFNNYPILYLAFHGLPGSIDLADEERLNLDDLGKMLRGSCQHRIIHFGACSTLDLKDDDPRLVDFRRQTEVLAVIGYKKDVDWLTSMAFEVLLLSTLQGVTFTYQGTRSVDRTLDKMASGLREALGVRMHYGGTNT